MSVCYPGRYFATIETVASIYPILAPFYGPIFTIGTVLLVSFYLYIVLAIPIFNTPVKRGLIK